MPAILPFVPRRAAAAALRRHDCAGSVPAAAPAPRHRPRV